MPIAHLRTLGPVELTLDGGPPPRELTWSKPLALLLYLARSPRRTRARGHLVGLLWGEKAEGAARHSLDVEVARIRKHLGAQALEGVNDQLRLADAAVTLDLDQFEAAERAESWTAAAALVGGNFVEGFEVDGASALEDWLAMERLTWRQRGVAALAGAASAGLASGDVRGAADLAQRALALDPGSDRAMHALVRTLALGGDRHAAIQAFDDFSVRLASGGLEPSRSLAALVERIQADRGPARAPSARLPAVERRAPLVGRGRELAALCGEWTRLAEGRAGYLAIVADGGMGRTRLADEVTLRARLDGAACLIVRAVPSDQERPWNGWRALAGAGLLGAPGVTASSPRALATFAASLEQWRECFPGPESQPFEQGTALAEVLRAVALEQPVLVVVDDAQWLDAATLAALDHVVRTHQGLPLAVLLALAPVPARDDLDAIRARIGRDVPGVVVRLGTLGDDDIQALVDWALPGLPGNERGRVTRRVASDAAGLPLLAVELLHAVTLGLELVPRSRTWPAPGRTLDHTLPGDLPDSLIAAVRVGFSARSPGARAVLEALAIMPPGQPADVLAMMAGLDPAAAAAALDELEYSRWVTADARGYAYVANVMRLVVERDMVTGGMRRRMLARLRPSGDARQNWLA